jgi:hypothetical protein
MNCKKCGSKIIGDGYSSVLHCEMAEYDSFYDKEPDSEVVFCELDYKKEDKSGLERHLD